MGITPQVAEVECILLTPCSVGRFCLHAALHVSTDVPERLFRAALCPLHGQGVPSPLWRPCFLKSDLVALSFREAAKWSAALSHVHSSA